MPTNINNKKPNTLIINMLRNFNVELAGFEPASRYGNHISSTCLDNY